MSSTSPDACVQDIQIKLDPSNRTRQHDFSEDMGHLLASWGFRAQPEGCTARQLVAIGLARSTGERGIRQLRYEALDDPATMLRARSAQTDAFLDCLRKGARAAPSGPRQELSRMARTIEELNREMAKAIRRIGERGRA